MDDAESYTPALALGDVMVGGAVSEVMSSTVHGFAAGDFVVGYTGWQEYALSDGSNLHKVDPTIAPSADERSERGVRGEGPETSALARLLPVVERRFRQSVNP